MGWDMIGQKRVVLISKWGNCSVTAALINNTLNEIEDTRFPSKVRFCLYFIPKVLIVIMYIINLAKYFWFILKF